MLVVDFMHKCELGTWKALFTHLIRLLYALPRGSELVAALDSRFQQVPTFGLGVIHCFSNNTSEMKRLAACDFEDILQCAIPVFEGLFPDDHDAMMQSLLYQFAQWHALAKLRLHLESTVNFLEETFKKLSQKLWKFRDFTCTYKFHVMGDYVRTIKLFGTTDSFTTQIGELTHRALKAFYPLTNKLDTPAQLAKHERRHCVLQRVGEVGNSPSSSSQQPVHAPPLVSYDNLKHHYIATTQNNPVNLFTFLQSHDGDPTLKNFIPKLRDHVLYRLHGLDIGYCDHIFMDKEQNLIIIPNNTIYSVQTMQVHYMTYNLWHKYNTINPRTHGDIMVLSGETRPMLQHLEVLWVRWLVGLQGHKSGMKYACLPKMAFVEESDRDAFGFLDPGQVI
ncbi:hypothetical protein BDR05DRAFT_975806 [Suillus weaverae]|nr:hypothetical protein BDR05DRAFT_975806 [Suillus weaverae]